MARGWLGSTFRELLIHHISIRVPWHDRGWGGSVCDSPKGSTSCLALRSISEEKDDGVEHAVRATLWKEPPEASWPGCKAEHGAFMAPFQFTHHLTHACAESSAPGHPPGSVYENRHAHELASRRAAVSLLATSAATVASVANHQ